METPAQPQPRDAERLVRQHARTAQLLGVDFVPAYRTGDTGVVAVTVVAAAEDAAEPEPPIVEIPKPKTQPPVTPAAVAPTPPPPSVRPPQGPMVEVPKAKDRAANEAALAALRARYEKDAPHDRFDTSFQNIVWGEGDPAARLCFVGEAPGEDEDKSGRPFVGRAGQLLDKMILAMGLRREDVYICNVLKTRPPGNRTPTFEEVEACRPYLLEQLSIVRPEAVVGLGLSACGALLGGGEPMSRLRARWWEIADARGVKIPFMPTYHPAFILRSYTEDNRAKVWADLKMVMDRLGIQPPAKKPA
jgi:uracil-DNA glycosylase